MALDRVIYPTVTSGVRTLPSDKLEVNGMPIHFGTRGVPQTGKRNMTTPIVQSMLLAERVYRDESTKNFVICGVFDTYKSFVASDPGEAPSEQQSREKYPKVGTPYLYICFTELYGETEVRIQYVNRKTQEVLREWTGKVHETDPLKSVALVLPLPYLDVERDGNFGFDVLCEGHLIGSLRVKTDVIEIVAEAGGKSHADH